MDGNEGSVCVLGSAQPPGAKSPFLPASQGGGGCNLGLSCVSLQVRAAGPHHLPSALLRMIQVHPYSKQPLCWVQSPQHGRTSASTPRSLGDQWPATRCTHAGIAGNKPASCRHPRLLVIKYVTCCRVRWAAVATATARSRWTGRTPSTRATLRAGWRACAWRCAEPLTAATAACPSSPSAPIAGQSMPLHACRGAACVRAAACRQGPAATRERMMLPELP